MLLRKFGGYVPGVHIKGQTVLLRRLQSGAEQGVLAGPPSVPALYSHGPFTNKTTINSYAAKVTFKLNEGTSIDASVFSDPSKTNAGFGFANEDTFPFFPNLNLAMKPALAGGTMVPAVRPCTLTSSLSPTWQLDMSGSAKRSHFNEVGLQNVYQIVDYSGVVQAGNIPRKDWALPKPD